LEEDQESKISKLPRVASFDISTVIQPHRVWDWGSRTYNITLSGIKLAVLRSNDSAIHYDVVPHCNIAK